MIEQPGLEKSPEGQQVLGLSQVGGGIAPNFSFANRYFDTS